MNETTLDKLSHNPHYKMSNKQLEELSKARMHNTYFEKHPKELKLHDYEPIERTKRDGSSRGKMPLQSETPKDRKTNKL